jgi:beta-aspartyl-dipeptidase (metallo-type)
VLTILREAELYAPEASGRVDLVIGGGRVLGIGADLAKPPGVYVREERALDGARVIPGLIDAHVHVTGGGGEGGFASRVPPLAVGALASAGITSVVGVLGTDTTTRTIEDLVARTLGLREEGLAAWCWTGGYQTPPRTLTGRVRDDVVFVDPIIGVGELAISDHRSSQPTFEELVRVASDCHVAGLTTGKAGCVHLHLGDGPRGLELVRRAVTETELPARVFQPTHVNRNPRLLDEAIELAKAHGVPIDVTAFDDTAADAIARILADAPSLKPTCSSDGGGCLPTFDRDGRMVAMDVGRPSALLDALRALLARDVPLQRALPAFTSHVADQLRLEGRGRIRAGAHADLVILDPDGGVASVMAGGRWLYQGAT